jgi:hypothetical protein
VRDASVVAWKPALRAAVMLALPAGLLCSSLSPLRVFGLFWMTSAAAWAVTLYLRGQQAPWITTGAGARIGMVTGIMAGWLAFALSGGAMFVDRFVLHHSSQIDTEWRLTVEANQQIFQKWAEGMGSAYSAQVQVQLAQQRVWMLSPWGHAGIETFDSAMAAMFLILFAIVGGAMGARFLARTRRPEV